MVLRCAWGTCTVDERYPDRMVGVRFILFPKPITNLDKCQRWIKACGRPHDQLNVDRINKHKAICSKHFVGGDGPTDRYPDPLPADGSRCTPIRHLPKKRSLPIETLTCVKKGKKLPFDENTDILNCPDKCNEERVTKTVESSTQTDENYGTELRTQTPCALGLQSQLYSDYKSSTTLKGLVGCDPNGTIMFISELHSGAISDKSITEESGFYEILKCMKEHGFVRQGDAIMADKGFTIGENLQKLGLTLNIPPFAKSGAQMSCAQVNETQKIAKHRVHIERLISKIKTFKIVSHRVPTTLFSKINQIWAVCCHLTLFQDVFVKDKQ